MLICEETGIECKPPIKLDGSDTCHCTPCKRRALISQCTGTADIHKNTLKDALHYLNEWDDKAEAERLIGLVQKGLEETSDRLRQATGERPLTTYN